MRDVFNNVKITYNTNPNMQSDFLTWRRIQNNTLYQIFITLFCLLPTVLSYSIQLLFLSLFSSFYKILQFLLLVLIRNISSIYSNLFILFSIFKDYKVSGGGLPWWLCKQDHKINNSKTGTINISSSFFYKRLTTKAAVGNGCAVIGWD